MRSTVSSLQRPASRSLSASAKACIGLMVSFVVLFSLLLGMVFWYRRRRLEIATEANGFLSIFNEPTETVKQKSQAYFQRKVENGRREWEKA